MMNNNVTQGIVEKQRAMLRDPRQHCLYVFGRRCGHSLYLKALKETMAARGALLNKTQNPDK
jgi:hypothetical protein